MPASRRGTHCIFVTVTLLPKLVGAHQQHYCPLAASPPRPGTPAAGGTDGEVTHIDPTDLLDEEPPGGSG